MNIEFVLSVFNVVLDVSFGGKLCTVKAGQVPGWRFSNRRFQVSSANYYINTRVFSAKKSLIVSVVTDGSVNIHSLTDCFKRLQFRLLINVDNGTTARWWHLANNR